MSYILDALKKAERQRQAGAVPRLSTVHAPAPSRQRPVWKLVLAAALLVNAALGIVLLRQGPPFSPAGDGTVQPRDAAVADAGGAAPVETATAPADPPATPTAVAVEPASEGPAPVDPPPAEPAATVAASAPRPGPERSAVTTAKPSSEPPASESTATTKPAPPKPTGAKGVSKKAAARPPGAAPVPDAASPPRPIEAAPAAASPPRPELPAAFRQAVSGMRLEVLVYADDPAGRQVFINGRRYVQGERIDGTILVERIVGEGVVLSWQGHRHLLRHMR